MREPKVSDEVECVAYYIPASIVQRFVFTGPLAKELGLEEGRKLSDAFPEGFTVLKVGNQVLRVWHGECVDEALSF